MKNLLLTILILLFIVACKPSVTQTENSESKNEAPEVSKEDNSPKACTKDLKVCPDGNSVVRDPDNNCEFTPCPVEDNKEQIANETTEVSKEDNMPKVCTKELKVCADGNSVARNSKNNCEFTPCPGEIDNTSSKKYKKEPMMCTADAKECPDGSFVGRDHYNNCKFKECPKTEITKKEKI